MQVKCSCGVSLAITPELVGKRVRCKACKKILEIRAPSSEKKPAPKKTLVDESAFVKPVQAKMIATKPSKEDKRANRTPETDKPVSSPASAPVEMVAAEVVPEKPAMVVAEVVSDNRDDENAVVASVVTTSSNEPRKVKCQCGSTLKIPTEYRKPNVRCPKCGATIDLQPTKQAANIPAASLVVPSKQAAQPIAAAPKTESDRRFAELGSDALFRRKKPSSGAKTPATKPLGIPTTTTRNVQASSAWNPPASASRAPHGKAILIAVGSVASLAVLVVVIPLVYRVTAAALGLRRPLQTVLAPYDHNQTVQELTRLIGDVSDEYVQSINAETMVETRSRLSAINQELTQLAQNQDQSVASGREIVMAQPKSLDELRDALSDLDETRKKVLAPGVTASANLSVLMNANRLGKRAIAYKGKTESSATSSGSVAVRGSGRLHVEVLSWNVSPAELGSDVIAPEEVEFGIPLPTGRGMTDVSYGYALPIGPVVLIVADGFSKSIGKTYDLRSATEIAEFPNLPRVYRDSWVCNQDGTYVAYKERMDSAIVVRRADEPDPFEFSQPKADFRHTSQMHFFRDVNELAYFAGDQQWVASIGAAGVSAAAVNQTRFADRELGAIAVSSNGRFVAIVESGASLLQIVSTDTSQRVAAISLGNAIRPSAVGFSDDGKRLWLHTGNLDDQIACFDTADGSLIKATKIDRMKLFQWGAKMGKTRLPTFMSFPDSKHFLFRSGIVIESDSLEVVGKLPKRFGIGGPDPVPVSGTQVLGESNGALIPVGWVPVDAN